MKWTTVLALGSACLSSTASAASSGESFKVAEQELNHINLLATNLTRSIKEWDGKDYGQALFNIHSPAIATCDYVKNATKVLRGYNTTYDINHSFRIGTPAQNLSYAVNQSVATLNSRYAAFKTTSLLLIVEDDLQCLLGATRNYSDLLVSYITPIFQPIGKALSQQFVDSLQMGVDCATKGAKMDCNSAVIDGEARYRMAVDTNAMYADGSPIA